MARFTNPVRYADGVVRTNPDPYVLRFRGRYYCYATGHDGVGVSTSDDLVTWTSLGSALQVEGREQYWAPCVTYADGLFWMYWSDRPAGSDDPHEEVLHVASSPVPQGPFTVRRRLFDTFSIDPHVVRDPASGQYVLFYSTNDLTGENAGTSIVVDRLLAMDVLSGDPRPVVLPTLDEEIFERDRFGDGRDWYTIEGAQYFTHHDTAFLTYSGNAYVGTGYFIGYARAALSGPVANLQWSKYPNDYVYAPLVRRNDHVEGTGHNSVVKAPDLVEDWIVYHGRDTDQVLDPSVEQRVMRIDRLLMDGDRLVTDAPTASEQEGPTSPTILERFDGASLSSAWQVVSGGFTVADEAVRAEPVLRSLLVNERQVRHFVAEAYVRAVPSDAGARYGFVPVYHGEDDHVAILVDVARGQVQAVQVRRGLTETLGTASLAEVSPAGFEPAAWLHLRVERTFDLIEVWLADLLVLAVRFDDDRPGRVGFLAVTTTAELSALTVTEHLDLWGPRLRYLPQVFRASRPVAVTERGIRATGRRPLRLAAPGLEPAVTLTHEVELVAPYAHVELAFVGPRASLRVQLTPTSYEVLLATDGVERQVAKGEHSSRRTSVRTRITQGAVAVRVGDYVTEAPCPAWTGLEARVELSGAVYLGFQMTPVVGDDPSDHDHEIVREAP
jgi:GH43 family beta-xylosidase